MDIQNLQDLRNRLSDEMTNRLAYFDRRIATIEELQKGSVNSREGRVRTEVQLDAAVKDITRRVEKLEQADKDLSNRFFQIWSAIFLAFVGILIDFLRKS